jgi:hypothetical protein
LAARTIIAKHIIATAKAGNLNRQSLADGAFLYLAKKKLYVPLGDGRSLSSVSLARILNKPETNARRSQPLNNATAFGIVRADFNLHSVAHCEAYVMNLKLPCGLGQYAMPAVQGDAKKVTPHSFRNGAKEAGSRFLHYSLSAHSCPAAIAANIAWRNASSALTASERACIAATAAWSFGSSSRGRKSRYPAVMVMPLGVS